MSPQTFLWSRTRQISPLPLEHVHIWAWDLGLPPLPHDWEILSEEEVLRARRFVFPRDRDRYVRAHSITRALISACSEVGPTDLIFSTNEFGKPHIQNQLAEPLHFNLTHSAGIAALAVSRRYRVGVDLEMVRPIDADIAEHHFSATELATLENLPPDQWLSGFFRCWTAKEALLKGVGLGLNLPLDAFDVEADPRQATAMLGSRLPNIASEWLLFDLKPASSAIGTLAVLDETCGFKPEQLRCFSFEG